MSKKRKYSELLDRCRICFIRNASMMDLFSENVQKSIKYFEKAVSYQIKHVPEAPSNVCHICLYKLEMLSELIQIFMTTEEKLNLHCGIDDPKKVTLSNEQPDFDTFISSLELESNQGKRQKVKEQDILHNNIENVDASVEESYDLSSKKEKPKDIPALLPLTAKPTDNALVTKLSSSLSEVIKGNLEDKLDNTKEEIGRTMPVRKSSTKKEELTKRWEDRKKALRAASGENTSDSDSCGETLQLSPIQKARILKDAEKLKLKRALKNLETNLTDKYKVNHTEQEEQANRKTRLSKSLDRNKVTNTKIDVNVPNSKIKIEDTSQGNKVEHLEREMGVDEIMNESAKNIPTNNDSSTISKKNDQSQNNKEEDVFNQKETSRHLKTEDLGLSADSLYEPVITEPEISNNIDVKKSRSGSNSDILSELKKNLVESRIRLKNATFVVRTILVTPESLDNSGNKQIDIFEKYDELNLKNDSNTQNCLKVEVEGMEFDTLRQAQLELAKHVKNLNEEKLYNQTDLKEADIIKNQIVGTLDVQLKDIVEKILKKNSSSPSKPVISKSKTVSANFAKAAEDSEIFQPEVSVPRLDVGESGQTIFKNIQKSSTKENQRRRSKLPKKFEDFNLESDENVKVINQSKGMKPVIRKPENTNPAIGMKIERRIIPLIPNIGIVNKIAEKSLNNSQKNDVINQTSLTNSSFLNKNCTNAKNISTKPIIIENAITIDSESEASSGMKEMNSAPTLARAKSKTPVREIKPTIPVRKSIPKMKNSSEINNSGAKNIENIPVESSSLKKIYEKIPNISNKTTKMETSTPIMPSQKSVSSIQKINPTISLNLSKEDTQNSQRNLQSKSPTKVNTLASKVDDNRAMKDSIGRKTPVKEKTLTPSHVNRRSLEHKTPTKNIPSNQESKAAKSPITPRQRHICGLCGVELFSKEEAEAHVKSHKMKETEKTTPTLQAKPKLMRCKRCQAVVESQHVKQHVCSASKHRCKTCELDFETEKLLAEHCLLHNKSNKTKKIVEKPIEKSDGQSNEKLFTCFLCDKRISGEKKMKDHLQYHCNLEAEQNANDFQCSVCGEKFSTEETLEEHIVEHVEERNEDDDVDMINNQVVPENPNYTIYTCPQCPESFDSSLLLAMHLTTHQEEEDEPMDIEDEPTDPYDREMLDDGGEVFVCNICDEIFDSPEELSNHIDIHKGKTHVCILCEKSFLSILDLREHVSSHLQNK